MDLKEFLTRVVPASGGNYWAGSIKAQGAYSQRSFDDLASTVAYIEAKSRARADCYFATGVYRGPRQIANTVAKKAFYVDLDCGHGKPYGTQREALTALLEWCRDHFTLPSIIVSSGGGAHVYWTLDKPVPPSVWTPLAQQLKNRCIEHGLEIDPTTTADAARILRAPGTHNYKTATPRPVQVIWSSPRDYTIEEMQQLLDVVPPALQPELALIAGANDLTAGVGGSDRPRYAAKMIPLCNVFRETLETHGEHVSGLAWTHQLSVLAHCVDGAEFAHQISNEHPSYVREATDRKWAKALEKVGTIGPPKCDTLAGFFPSACASCEHRGKITTPLQLGGDYRIPGAMPWPFQQDAKGVFYMATKKDDEGNDISFRQEVVPFRIEEFEVLETLDTTLISFSAKYPDETEPALVNYSDLLEKRTAMTELSRHHIPIGDHHYTGFRNLMSSWTMQMKSAKMTKPMVPHLGWVSSGDQKGFATATEIFWADGTVSQNTSRSRQLLNMYTPVGTDEPWRAAASVLLKQRQAIIALVLTAFAAPLVKWTAAPGVIMSFVSRESGSGKSTAMKLAQAVWGDPVAGVNALNDTPASVIHKIAYTNNLPAYWDEVRARTQAAEFIKMVYSISQGKERSRLNSDVTMRNVGTWSTMLAAASNESIADHAEHVVEDSESGRVRIFEVQVPIISAAEADPQLYRHINALRENFGTVGRQYAQYLALNHDTVKTLVARVSEALQREVQGTQTDRFWVSAMASLLCAAALVKRAGIADVDAVALKDWLLAQLAIQRGASAAAYEPTRDRATTLVADFANDHRQQLIICDFLRKRGGAAASSSVISIAPQQGPIAGVLAQQEGVFRVHMRMFRDWLYIERKESPSQIFAELQLRGSIETRAQLDWGMPNAVGARVRCYDIPLAGMGDILS